MALVVARNTIGINSRSSGNPVQRPVRFSDVASSHDPRGVSILPAPRNPIIYDGGGLSDLGPNTMLAHFDLGFEIMPATGDADLTPKKNPYEAEAPADTSGG